MMTEQPKNDFDTWWQCAVKPADSMLTIPKLSEIRAFVVRQPTNGNST
jgi:hypothetical protein